MKGMRAGWARRGAIATIWLLMVSCGGAPADAELSQAAQAMAQLARSRHLERSCFYVVYPQGTPTDFVGYLFSDLGSADWPVAFEPLEAEQMQSAGITPLPGTVKISAQQREQPEQKELVLLADDAAGDIQLLGYLPNETEPNVEERIPLTPANPEDFTVQMCQSSLEMGVSPGPDAPD